MFKKIIIILASIVGTVALLIGGFIIYFIIGYTYTPPLNIEVLEINVYDSSLKEVTGKYVDQYLIDDGYVALSSNVTNLNSPAPVKPIYICDVNEGESYTVEMYFKFKRRYEFKEIQCKDLNGNDISITDINVGNKTASVRLKFENINQDILYSIYYYILLNGEKEKYPTRSKENNIGGFLLNVN